MGKLSDCDMSMIVEKCKNTGSHMLNFNIEYLTDILLKDGKLQVLPASVYECIPNDHLRIFCVKHGVYQLPTTELVEWVKKKIAGRKAIEIGAGNGAFAEALGIIATDSYQQDDPVIVKLYNKLGQEPVQYGKNVKRYDAKSAIKKFRPNVVIANWVTQVYREDSDQGNMWGVDEQKVLNNVSMYIHIGNKHVHKKRILRKTHDEYQFPWLFSRAKHPEDNVIYVWDKRKRTGRAGAGRNCKDS